VKRSRSRAEDVIWSGRSSKSLDRPAAFYFLRDVFLAVEVLAVFLRAPVFFSTVFKVDSTAAAPPSMNLPTLSRTLPTLVARLVAVCVALAAFFTRDFAPDVAVFAVFFAPTTTRSVVFLARVTGVDLFVAADLRAAMLILH
jgi:hypothetical protein